MRLGKFDVAANFRIAIDHDVVDGRGRTRISVERSGSGDEWAAVRSIDVSNAGLFVLHDAIGRACSLAMKERR